MESMVQSLSSEPAMVLGVVLGLAGMVALVIVVAVIAASATKQTRERETARREIAAYVAEGAITPEDAERLLQPRPWYARTGWTGGWTVGGSSVRQAAREAARAARDAARSVRSAV